MAQTQAVTSSRAKLFYVYKEIYALVPGCRLARGTSTPPHKAAPHLEEDKELEDASEGGWEEASVGHCHLEEERVEEAIAHIDQGVLVEVGVADAPVVPPGSPAAPVVVGRVVVVGVRLVLGHPDACGREPKGAGGADLGWRGPRDESQALPQRGRELLGAERRVGAAPVPLASGVAGPARPPARRRLPSGGRLRPGGAQARLRGSAGRCLGGARERRGPSRPSGDAAPGPAPRPWGEFRHRRGAARSAAGASALLAQCGAERPGPLFSAPSRHLPPPAPRTVATRLRERHRGTLGRWRTRAGPRPAMQSRRSPAMHRARPVDPYGSSAKEKPKFLTKRRTASVEPEVSLGGVAS